MAKTSANAAKVVQTARAVRKNSIELGRGEHAEKEIIGANFTKGVEVIKTTKDLNLYRYFGGNAAAVGSYLSNGPIGKFIDRRGLALRPEWNNTMESIAEI